MADLYYFNASSVWEFPDNWFLDSGATIPSPSLPGSGDSVYYAGGVSGTVTISSGTNLDLVMCQVDLSISGGASVSSGSYTGAVTNNGATISGGTFTNFANSRGFISGGTFTVTSALFTTGGITGGTFTGSGSGDVLEMHVVLGSISAASFNFNSFTLAEGETYNCTFACTYFTNAGTIIGGTFTGQPGFNMAFVNNGAITGGTFSGDGFTNQNSISGGTFDGADFYNSATGAISGGTFNGNDVTNDGSITAGNFTGSGFDASTGSVSGSATYTPTVTVAFATLISGSNLQIAATLSTIPDDPGGFAAAGGFTPTVIVSGIPSGGNALGTGFLSS